MPSGFSARLSFIGCAIGVVAWGCGSGDAITPPTAPPPVNTLSLGNTWTVYLSLDSCASNRSECPTYETASFFEVTLRTATVGQQLTAVMQSRATWITNLPVVLTGQLQPDRTVRYRGRYQSDVIAGAFRDLDVQELSLSPDDHTGLKGSLLLVDSVQFSSGSFYTKTVRATVRSASRQPFADTSRVFQGVFDGFGTLRSCEGTCPNRSVGSRMTVSLRLTQSGTVITGEFGTMPVTGTDNGTSVLLTGEWQGTLDQSGIGTTISRLESLTAFVDALGRLTGTMRLYNEGVYDSRPGAGTERAPFTERLTIDMTTVIRQ